MENIGYPLLCRWGGKIVTQREEVSYEGGDVRMVLINSQMSFNDLLKKVCEITGLDRSLDDVKLLMRYPTYGGHVAVPLDDDYTLKAVWTCRAQAPSLELYVKQTQASTQACHPNVPQSSTQVSAQSSMTPEIGLNTRMLNDNTNESDQFHLSPTPQHFQSEKELETIEHGNTNLKFDSARTDSDVGRNITPPENVDYINFGVTSHGDNEFDLDGDFMVGQQFKSKAELLNMVKLWSIRRNYMFKTMESRPTTVALTCGQKRNEQTSETCTWRLRASKTSDGFFKIVRYNGSHAPTCVAKVLELSHKKLDHHLIGENYKDILAADPDVSVRAIMELVKQDFQCTVSYKKAWRAKQWGLKLISGSSSHMT